MKVKKLAKKMKELNLKLIGCEKCPFIGKYGECTLEGMCVANYKDILTIENFFKEAKEKFEN